MELLALSSSCLPHSRSLAAELEFHPHEKHAVSIWVGVEGGSPSLPTLQMQNDILH